LELGRSQLFSPSPVHGGTAAISFEPDGWTGLFFHRDLGLQLQNYEAVEFWIRGSGTGGQLMTFAVTTGGTPLGQAHALGEFLPGGTLSTSWTFVRVPFASLGVTSGSPDGFWFQDASGGNQTTIYVDDVRLAERTTPPPPPTTISVSINVDADRHPVSPQIYGVSFGDDGQAGCRRWPIRRWGGNATTRYSWQDDTANRAFDYLFMNIPEPNPNPGALPNGSAVDHLLNVTRAAGGEPILTVPTIGWTPRDRAVRWGFSVAKCGAQQQTECTINPFPGCNADAGNGVKPNGTNVTGNDPHDTSRGSYAIRSADGRLFLLLFNKDTVVRHVDSALVSGTYTGSATLYRFDGTRRLGLLGTATPSGGELSLDLPARSATLAVLRLAGGAPAPGSIRSRPAG
jgi:hypothetical protein